MKAYRGTFTKQNGEARDMSFVHLEDIYETSPDFIPSRIIGTGLGKVAGEEMELVWDLEQDNFRYFNYGKMIGELQEYNIDETIFIE